MAGLKDDEVDPDLLRAAYSHAGSAEELIGLVTREMIRDDIPPGSAVLPTADESADFAAFCSSSRAGGSPLNIAADALLGQDWSDVAMKTLIREVGGKSKTAGSLGKIRRHLEACRGIRGIIDLSEALFGDPSGCGAQTHFRELLSAGAEYVPGGGDESADLAAALKNLLAEMNPYVVLPADSGGSVESLVKPHMRCAFIDSALKTLEPKVEKLKASEGRWGYADLIRRVSEAVKGAASPLRDLCRKRFRAALIDEFQDTDPRQWELFRNIFEEPEHLLVLIGDPKQSIYGFRGTGLQAYRTARSAVDADHSYRLDTNYRSLPPLVESVNRIFSPIFRRGTEGNPPVGFEPVLAGKKDTRQLIRKGGVSPLTILEIDTEGTVGLKAAASTAIVSEIRSLLDPVHGAKWLEADGSLSILPASDIAILARSARDEEDILRRLRQGGIPAIRIRSRSVFDQPVVPLMRSLLEALDRPRDISRWKSVLLGGFFRIPPGQLLRYEEDGYLDAFVERGEAWRDSFLAGRSSEALDDFFDFMPVAGNPARPWPEMVLASEDGERTWQDWRHLCDLVQEAQSEGLREPADLILHLDESAKGGDPEGREDAIRLETESPAVRVMTMHASKGLEFPLVFIHGGYGTTSRRRSGDEYRFNGPEGLVVDRIGRESNRRAHLAYAWEEDKRLWYVAFTRASVGIWVPRPLDGPVTGIDSLLAAATGYDNPKQDDSIPLPPHETVAAGDSEAFRAGLNDALRFWSEGGNAPMCRVAGAFSEYQPLIPPDLPRPIIAKLPEDRPGDRDPVTSSYTSLGPVCLGAHADVRRGGRRPRCGPFPERTDSRADRNGAGASDYRGRADHSCRRSGRPVRHSGPRPLRELRFFLTAG